MNFSEEFDFFNQSIEYNLSLLENKMLNINYNLDFEYKLYKINNLITIFCHDLFDELKNNENKIEHTNNETCLNYNNILNNKIYILNEISTFDTIKINEKINIVKKNLTIYFEALENYKNIEDYNLDF